MKAMCVTVVEVAAAYLITYVIVVRVLGLFPATIFDLLRF